MARPNVPPGLYGFSASSRWMERVLSTANLNVHAQSVIVIATLPQGWGRHSEIAIILQIHSKIELLAAFSAYMPGIRDETK